jgi:catechol 2,3-dioxygenase-like lactoylglutathione lyase family enzyme
MSGDDPRPPVWVGHVTLATPDLPATRDFMLTLGMRDIAQGDGFAVLELRGGTHLVLLPAEKKASGDAYFDLMVEDVAATHEELRSKGLSPSPIEEGQIHSSFTVASPSGHTIKFNSTHVSDLPV